MPEKDAVRLGIINNYPLGGEPERIRRFNDAAWAHQATVEVRTISPDSISLLKIDEFDGIILSGSSLNISDPVHREKIRSVIGLIKSTEIPVLAVCFGLHLGMFVYGETVDRNENSGEYLPQWGKEIDIEVVSDPEGLIKKTKVKVNVCHRDYVAPDGVEKHGIFDVRAVSSDGPLKYIQYAKHREKPLYCVQFHPECFDDATDAAKEQGNDIISNFIDIVRRQ